MAGCRPLSFAGGVSVLCRGGEVGREDDECGPSLAESVDGLPYEAVPNVGGNKSSSPSTAWPLSSRGRADWVGV